MTVSSALEPNNGWIFALWSTPENADTLPDEAPAQIFLDAPDSKVWLAAVGDEQAMELQQRWGQKLRDMSSEKARPCGLSVEVAGFVAATDVSVVAYFLSNPCRISPPRQHGGATPLSNYPWVKTFYVATIDAQGVVRHAFKLGENTDDIESVSLLPIENQQSPLFAVRRDWGKHTWGPAAATSDGWLLTVSSDLQLHNALSLGHWSLNDPASPKNGIADIYVSDVDANPPSEVLVYRADNFKAYHSTPTAQLAAVPMNLSAETRESIVKGKTLWQLHSN